MLWGGPPSQHSWRGEGDPDPLCHRQESPKETLTPSWGSELTGHDVADTSARPGHGVGCGWVVSGAPPWAGGPPTVELQPDAPFCRANASLLVLKYNRRSAKGVTETTGIFMLSLESRKPGSFDAPQPRTRRPGTAGRVQGETRAAPVSKSPLTQREDSCELPDLRHNPKAS